MYREDFGGGAAGFGRYHLVAEPMRRGCEIRSIKVKGCFVSGKNGACALGAAMVGIGKKLPGRQCVAEEIYEVFPELRDVIEHPLQKCKAQVLWIVNDLSEDTDWSREAIANWLCVSGGCSHEVIGSEIVLRDEGLDRLHEVAEAIRHGCQMRLKKLRNGFRRGANAACALGAAMAAVEAESGEKCRVRKLKAVFPELEHRVVHPRTGHWMTLEKVIVSLNDAWGQSREEIAGWLCRLGECIHDVSEPEIKLERRLSVVA